MRIALLCLCLTLSFACRSTKRPMEELFKETVADFGETKGLVGLEGEASERHIERLGEARKAAAEGKLDAASEFMFAAAVLATSQQVHDLALAERLALRAGELGDERGAPLAGEVIDKRLWLTGEPQRYGTQIVYDKEAQRWRLWDLDPKTTDLHRRMMGLPKLEALQHRADLIEKKLGDWMREQQAQGE